METLQLVEMENLLNLFEEELWMVKLLHEMQTGSSEDKLAPARLRNALISNDFSKCIDIFNDVERLSKVTKSTEILITKISNIVHWYFASKRVFNLSSELSDMLVNTDLPDFNITEIKVVANSYVIKLNKPLVGVNGLRYYFLICNYFLEEGQISISAYPEVLTEWQALDIHTKHKVEKDAKNRNYGLAKFGGYFSKKCERYSPYMVIAPLTDSKSAKTELETCLDQSEQPDSKLYYAMYQIAVGTNLYLQSSRKGDVEKITKINNFKAKGQRAITHEAELFELAISKLGNHGHSNSVELLGEDNQHPKSSVRPHFRRGHWRKAAREENCPPPEFATIWVRPTWVRKDKIEAGERPFGAQQTATTELVNA